MEIIKIIANVLNNDIFIFLLNYSLNSNIMSTIISVINNKGGVGKTVSAVNLAFSLVRGFKKVLLIDLDAQANATMCTVGEKDSHVGEWLVGEKEYQDVVVPTGYTGGDIDVLPAKRSLQTYEKAIGAEQDYQFILKERIEADKLNERYDYIIIDNAPSLSTLAYTTFIASSHILIPSAPEQHSVSGIQNIMQTVANVKKRYNPDLKVIGIFFTKYHSSYRERIDNDVVDGTREAYGKLVLETTIRKNVSVKEAQAYNQSIFEYAPESAGATDYNSLVKEVLTRL